MFDERSKVLFLGTIPSIGSVKNGFYYLGAGNAFWKLLSAVTSFDFVSLSEGLKKYRGTADGARYLAALERAVKDYKIALFDTISVSVRHGSRDDQIDEAVLQSKDLILDIVKNSRIKKIFCTSAQAQSNLFRIFGGRRAAQAALSDAADIETDEAIAEKLLSPSATALMYGQVTEEKRLEDWMKIKRYL